eukprot:gene6426-3053_t
MSAETPKGTPPSSFFLGKLNAAPFVPNSKSSGESQKGPASPATLSSAIKAAPFVPTSKPDASGSGAVSARSSSPAPNSTAHNSSGRWWKGGRGDYAGRGRGGGRAGRGSPTPNAGPSNFGGVGGFGQYGSLSGPGNTGSNNAVPAYRPHEQYAMGAGRAALAGQFVSDSLKLQLQERAYMVQAQWHAPDDSAGSMIPDKVQHYHTLYPLDDEANLSSNAEPSTALGLRTVVVKGVSSQDGQAYALRRIDGKQVIPSSDLLSQARRVAEQWSRVANHPHVVGLRAVFVSAEMESSAAMFFVHDFHPGAISLSNAHQVPRMTASGVVSLSPPTEPQLWSYLTQLASALRAAHSEGLIFRPSTLHPSKEALIGERDEIEDSQFMMKQDLTAVGQLLLSLACSGLSSIPSLDVCDTHFSMELTRLLGALCASVEGGALANWRQLAAALADRSLAEMDAVSVQLDNTMLEMSKECENGRLLRLLMKLGYVNERPELKGDSQWSETGDRYLLKLFRDYLFHQYSPDDGSPLVDWGHVAEALNKLDAGVPEKILLMSRDEASMLVVSYSDLKPTSPAVSYTKEKVQTPASREFETALPMKTFSKSNMPNRILFHTPLRILRYWRKTVKQAFQL